MGRIAKAWHVWHWDGTKFDLVWHDLPRSEAESLTRWRNARAIDAGTPHRYVMQEDGLAPIIP